MSTIVEGRPRGTYTPADCPSCKSQQEYQVPPTFIGNLRVRCTSCKSLFSHPQPKPGAGTGSSSTNNASSSRPGRAGFAGFGGGGGAAGGGGSGGGSAGGGGGGRGIGTDRNPLDMAYYNVLGLESQCTTDEVKKAYRRLAIKFHPDKNRDDPDAEEKFKQISIAYQVLSDPELRHKYNEFGQKNGGGVAEPAGGFQDPEEVFGKMFGGDQFESLIGQISIGKDMKDAFAQQAEQQDETIIGFNGQRMLTPDAMQRKMMRDQIRAQEKARIRQERVNKLAENLKNRMLVFTEAAKGPEDKLVGASFKEKCRIEAEQLKDENYGVELLNSIGRAYQAKAQQHMASSQFIALGWFQGAKNTFATVSDTVSTLKSAIELKQIFDRLQMAEQAGIAPEQLRKLEEQAAEQGQQTMWKGVKLEVESVVRETAEKVLTEPNVSKEKLHLRIVALEYMASAYLSIRKEGEADEFVKVETPASKQRDSAAASASEKTKLAGSAPGVPSRPGQVAQTKTAPEKPKAVPERPKQAPSPAPNIPGSRPSAPAVPPQGAPPTTAKPTLVPAAAKQAAPVPVAATKPTHAPNTAAQPTPAPAPATKLTSAPTAPTHPAPASATAPSPVPVSAPGISPATAEPADQEPQELLQAAYKAYESKRRSHPNEGNATPAP